MEMLFLSAHVTGDKGGDGSRCAECSLEGACVASGCGDSADGPDVCPLIFGLKGESDGQSLPMSEGDHVSCISAHDPQLSRLADAIAGRVGQQRFNVWFNNS